MCIGQGETVKLSEDLISGKETFKFVDWDEFWLENRHGRASPWLSDENEKDPDYKKLNLGCGSLVFKKENGWTNLDYNPGPGILQHDIYERPWPFDDDSFDFIYMSNILEHICHLHWFSIMAELFRISKDGAHWEITGPDPDNWVQTLQAPSHTGLVGPWTFFEYIVRHGKGDLNINRQADQYRLEAVDCEYSESRPTKWTRFYGAYFGGVNDYHFRKYLGRRIGEAVSMILGRPWNLRLVYRVLK
jgi:predicted SAM-dependent methyltransferase